MTKSLKKEVVAKEEVKEIEKIIESTEATSDDKKADAEIKIIVKDIKDPEVK